MRKRLRKSRHRSSGPAPQVLVQMQDQIDKAGKQIHRRRRVRRPLFLLLLGLDEIFAVTPSQSPAGSRQDRGVNADRMPMVSASAK